MKIKTMTEGTPWKHILSFALSVLAGSLLQQLYSTVDTIVVGRYSGEAALSAGNGVIVAQQFGSKNEKASEITLPQVFCLCWVWAYCLRL